MTEALFLIVLALMWTAVLSWLVLALAGASLARRAPGRARGHGLGDLPGVSVIVPARNEEEVIAGSLCRWLVLDYPADRLQVVVVDDGSSDATGAICDRVAARDDRVDVVHVAPGDGGKGKAAALNLALPVCRHPLIAVYDADTLPRTNALRELVAALGDGRYAAVVGRLVKANSGASLLRRMAALEFMTFQWTFQAGRSRLFDVVLLTGTNYLIRADVLRELGGWDPAALTEDLELSVRLYAGAHRVAFAPAAVAEEHDPSKLRVWIRQRTRWLLGNYYVVFRRTGATLRTGEPRALVVLWELYGLYTTFLVATVASQTIFVAGLIGALSVPVETEFLVVWGLAFLVFLAVVQLAAALEGADSWQTPLVAGAAYFVYAPLWLFVVARALVVYLTQRGELEWSKTPHTAS